MSTYQFNAIVKDGTICIPDEYACKLTSKVRVVIMPESKKVEGKTSLFPNLRLDTRGYKFDRDEANTRCGTMAEEK